MIFILKVCVVYTSHSRSRKWAQSSIFIELFDRRCRGKSTAVRHSSRKWAQSSIAIELFERWCRGESTAVRHSSRKWAPTGFQWQWRGSPIGFFNPAIPTGIFSQSRNPDGFNRLIPIPVMFSFLNKSLPQQKRSLKFCSRFPHSRPSRPKHWLIGSISCISLH